MLTVRGLDSGIPAGTTARGPYAPSRSVCFFVKKPKLREIFAADFRDRQYLACRRHKRNTLNALRFEAHQEENLLDLQAALLNRTYAPSRSVCFFVKKPKLREIFAADFRDRVVHHVLVDHLERIWEPIFIHDSYACRKGKGVHAGVERLTRYIRQITRNGSRPAWTLQLDIHNDFMSIDKAILSALLAPKIHDADALWLTRVRVFHDCTQDSVLKGDACLLDQIPPHKTLFHAPEGKGLPIGNLNSQFFANVYLNGLDQFVKHTLKCRHYLRYCDDFVLLSESREQLLDWRERIAGFLREPLRLELNPKRQKLRPVGDALFFQVGRFIEFYQPGDAALAARLGLAPLAANRRGALWGFPVAHAGRHLRRLLREGVAVTAIGETGNYWGRVQERLPRWRFEPLDSAGRA